jgi:aminopeptidase N
MKTKLYFTLLILSATIAFAQPPKFDHTFREEMARTKEKFTRELILNEQQITANQEDYDIKYYALDLTPDPTTKILSGIVQVVAEVIAPTLDRVELNFWDGMSITEVHPSNSPNIQLNYGRNNDILSINLDKTYVQGEKFSLVIVYNGRPQNSNYFSFSFDTYDGKPMIWTLSEPFGARAWWPCKDVPSDKADSVDIRVTVPSNLIVASNGTLRETIAEGNKTTYWWHEKYPIVTYLISLAIHPYEVHYDDYPYNNGTDTMKIHFYTFSGNYNQYSAINAKVKDMIACFSQLFGEYPFVEEKYGHADFLWGGGMEHQTCTSLGAWNEPTYAHELAHQWWGDLIVMIQGKFEKQGL